jgi:hypothetical protein
MSLATFSSLLTSHTSVGPSTTPSTGARFDAETALGIKGIVTLPGDQCGKGEDPSSILFSSTCPATSTTCPTEKGDGDREFDQAPTDTTNTSPTRSENTQSKPDHIDGITSLSRTEGGNTNGHQSTPAKWARVGAYAAALGTSCNACWDAIADGGINSPVSLETCATCSYMVGQTRLRSDPVDIRFNPPGTLVEGLIAVGFCLRCAAQLDEADRAPVACAACAAAAAAFVATIPQRNK